MSLRNTSFENWRLSRIEEEMERLSYSSQDTSADDGSCSPRSAEGTLERRGCGGKGVANMAGVCKDDGIYSSASLGRVSQGGSSREEENTKDGLRFIKEKYDSLGKVKVKKPCVDLAETVGVSVEGEGQRRPVEESPGCLKRNVPSVIVGNFETQVREYGDGAAVGGMAEAGARQAPPVQSARSPVLISEQELNQVEMFYRSHKASVFVCLCPASLYLSDPIRNSFGPVRPEDPRDSVRTDQPAADWTLVKAGIPVLVLDSGESRRQRRLNVILAERGTGFALWRDQIDCLTNYDAPSTTFHTMQLSNDHSKLVGLRFDDPTAASDFLQHIRGLTSDIDDPLLCLASSGDDRKAKKARKGTAEGKKQKGKCPTVSKADISQPCCFTHITKLDRNDGSSLLRGQASQVTECVARNSPRPGSGSGDRHKVKLKP